MAENKAADAVAAEAAADDPGTAPGSGEAEGTRRDVHPATPPGVATTKILTLTEIKVIRADGTVEYVEGEN